MKGTSVGRVRGLGSARSGAMPWWRQRLTAVANLLLVSWLLLSLVRLPALDHATVVKWIGNPLVAVPLLLLTVNVFTHLRLGLQVLFEDYVHDEGGKVAVAIALNFYTVAGIALAAFAIAKIALGGVAA